MPEQSFSSQVMFETPKGGHDLLCATYLGLPHCMRDILDVSPNYACHHLYGELVF